MKIISVKFAPWDNEYYFLSKDKNGNVLDIKVGDQVLVETIVGLDIAQVVRLENKEDLDQKIKENDLEVMPIVRLVNERDLEILRKNNYNNHKRNT